MGKTHLSRATKLSFLLMGDIYAEQSALPAKENATVAAC